MTSIEWLMDEMYKCGILKFSHPDNPENALFHKAKEMHQEEVEDAFQDGKWDWSEHLTNGTESKDQAQYYKEKFKNDRI